MKNFVYIIFIFLSCKHFFRSIRTWMFMINIHSLYKGEHKVLGQTWEHLFSLSMPKTHLQQPGALRWEKSSGRYVPFPAALSLCVLGLRSQDPASSWLPFQLDLPAQVPFHTQQFGMVPVHQIVRCFRYWDITINRTKLLPLGSFHFCKEMKH